MLHIYVNMLRSWTVIKRHIVYTRGYHDVLPMWVRPLIYQTYDVLYRHHGDYIVLNSYQECLPDQYFQQKWRTVIYIYLHCHTSVQILMLITNYYIYI